MRGVTLPSAPLYPPNASHPPTPKETKAKSPYSKLLTKATSVFNMKKLKLPLVLPIVSVIGNRNPIRLQNFQTTFWNATYSNSILVKKARNKSKK
jgi:hypothetical protein